MLDRLRRVTDLFVEGTEYVAGRDESGAPVVLWLNKLNSFQAAEAQKDALARRFLAIAELRDSGEYSGMLAELEMISHDRLCEDWVDLSFNEIYLEAMNDLDLDKELREERESLERVERLQDDAKVPEDSPEREKVVDYKRTWIGKLTDIHDAKKQEWLRSAKSMPLAELKEKFLEKWREMRTQAEFEREHRATQLFYAIRACSAVERDGGWDHTDCDHSEQWLQDRGDVHTLPDGLIEGLQERLDSITVPVRAAGNLDAPASSSESSGPSSASEAASIPSSPAETPRDARSTSASRSRLR